MKLNKSHRIAMAEAATKVAYKDRVEAHNRTQAMEISELVSARFRHLHTEMVRDIPSLGGPTGSQIAARYMDTNLEVRVKSESNAFGPVSVRRPKNPDDHSRFAEREVVIGPSHYRPGITQYYRCKVLAVTPSMRTCSVLGTTQGLQGLGYTDEQILLIVENEGREIERMDAEAVILREEAEQFWEDVHSALLPVRSAKQVREMLPSMAKFLPPEPCKEMVPTEYLRQANKSIKEKLK